MNATTIRRLETVLHALTSASSISNRQSEVSSCSSSGVPPSICIFSPSSSSALTAALCWACARMVLQTWLSEARMNDVTDGSILNVLDGVTGLSQADTARRSCEGIKTGITHWSLICLTAKKYYVYLDALFDPEVRSHCFPVLKENTISVHETKGNGENKQAGKQVTTTYKNEVSQKICRCKF